MTRHLATLRALLHPGSPPVEDYIFLEAHRLDHCGLVVEPDPYGLWLRIRPGADHLHTFHSVTDD
jgi:hypothetical protein